MKANHDIAQGFGIFFIVVFGLLGFFMVMLSILQEVKLTIGIVLAILSLGMIVIGFKMFNTIYLLIVLEYEEDR